MSVDEMSLQDRFAPRDICFGCGAANAQGLQLKSFDRGEFCIAQFCPRPEHQAFAGMLNGGIIGTLLDCHCNWTGALGLAQAHGAASPPCTVTAEYTIRLPRPTPADRPLDLRAWVVESSGRRVWVEGEIASAGVVSATCRGLFVAVADDHPANLSRLRTGG